MRYQDVIVERLRQGLAGVDHSLAQEFVDCCSPPATTLYEFSDRVNQHFAGLLKAHGVKPQAKDFEVPEDNDAIPYWVEDLENRVHPVLKAAQGKKDGTESTAA
ncbi:hypothetical protein HOV30_gp199 [Erwinia phage Derbicus]|uniref:Uncharacterized protein n=2 Tax=Derbicusvirus derbicus TaxID=2734104 RepID=A0A482IDU2_9CAUD|nr:hypothetical protein BIZ82_gp200 [Erwinia phage vB_EamM_EarlPhillipIV]YP_009821243.1 hypothetical protein HOV30_gp199 [Erwinia phage Derbicus]ANZ49049.1 hypothetical protein EARLPHILLIPIV_200 [Erwinia phage vB_EamM_EarlPhillipIV]QBP07625.1 hypothetical protein DERBICUS_199 [Erwinia phage Derbicus]QXO09920.1 hypothetical protein pEaSNUABM38_00198 [Erwinia phage pEa_SNUABM_38]